jgi:hypothetical protein
LLTNATERPDIRRHQRRFRNTRFAWKHATTRLAGSQRRPFGRPPHHPASSRTATSQTPQTPRSRGVLSGAVAAATAAKPLSWPAPPTRGEVQFDRSRRRRLRARCVLAVARKGRTSLCGRGLQGAIASSGPPSGPCRVTSGTLARRFPPDILGLGDGSAAAVNFPTEHWPALVVTGCVWRSWSCG